MGLFSGWNPPHDERSALAEVMEGVDQDRLAAMESRFPGISAAAYKRLLLKLTKEQLSYDRLQRVSRMFPNIMRDCDRIVNERNTPGGTKARTRLRRSYSSRSGGSYHYHGGFDSLDLLEIYYWSQILDVDPLLAFAVGDVWTAYIIEETQEQFNEYAAQEAAYETGQPTDDYEEPVYDGSSEYTQPVYPAEETWGVTAQEALPDSSQGGLEDFLVDTFPVSEGTDFSLEFPDPLAEPATATDAELGGFLEETFSEDTPTTETETETYDS